METVAPSPSGTGLTVIQGVTNQTGTSSTESTETHLATKALFIYFVLVAGYSIVYCVYSYLVEDDFGVSRDGLFSTLVNCMYLSAFVSAGSVPDGIRSTSTLARLTLTIHVVLAAIAKIWVVTC